MTDTPMIPDAGALEGTSPAPARTSSPAPQPAARTSGPSQAELDRAGTPRWNARPDPTGEQAAWDAKERARLGHATDPAAKPDQAAKPADGAADKTLKVGNTTITEAELSEFLTNKAARESGRLQAPDSPDGYKVELPSGFKPPEGVEMVLDQNNPAFGMLKNWAHRNGLPQSELSELIGIYGGVRAGELAINKMAHDTEIGRLGSAGPARVDALAMWMRGFLGDQGAVLTGTRGPDGKVTNGVMWTAGIVEAFEALQRKVSGAGGGGYRPNGGDNGGGGDGKIAGYEKMSFQERRFAQDQLRTQRGGR